MSERSINIGGSSVGSINSTGDNANIVQSHNQTAFQGSDVDIRQELAELRGLLEQLDTTNSAKISRALDDAEKEAAKDEPDKGEVKQAIERVMSYAEKANNYGEIFDKLSARLTPVAVWLGLNADKWLPMLGIG